MGKSGLTMTVASFGMYCTLCIMMAKELNARPQITKLVPVEDWIAFKHQTTDIKPLDKFLGKLRATYDFVFHKPDNVSGVDKILTKETAPEEPSKFPLLPIANGDPAMASPNYTNVYVELLPARENTEVPIRESAISRISKDNEWLDDEIEAEPLSELEIVDPDEDVDQTESVTPAPGLQLPIAVARALAKWLSCILGFTRGAYLNFAHSDMAKRLVT